MTAMEAAFIASFIGNLAGLASILHLQRTKREHEEALQKWWIENALGTWTSNKSQETGVIDE